MSPRTVEAVNRARFGGGRCDASGLRIVRPGEGRAWWWQGGIVRMPATGEDTGQRFMLEEATVPPGGGPAPHVQNREDESFDIIGGGPIEFTAGNRKAALGAGGRLPGRGTGPSPTHRARKPPPEGSPGNPRDHSPG